MKTVSTVLIALLLASFAQAQQRWTKTYGGGNYDRGYCVQLTGDGGYIVGGITSSFGPGDYDYYLIKTDASGDTAWTRTYGTSAEDADVGVVVISGGAYAVVGSSRPDTLSGDIWLLKINSSGDTVGSMKYAGGTGQYGYWIQPTPDAGYIISGNTKSFGAGSHDIYLIKTDSIANSLWTKTYGGAGYEAGWAQPTLDGGYVICGWTNSFGAGSDDVYLIKTNSSGDTLWTRTYGGAANDEGSQVIQTTDSGYVIAATTYSRGAGNSDIWLIKTNSSGDTLWTKTFGGASYDEGYSVEKTTDGGYIIAGQTQSFGAGSSDVWLLKTNASGDTVWTRTYGGAGNDLGFMTHQTSDGGYVVTGSTNSFGAGADDVYLIKTDANGSIGVEEPNGQRLARRAQVFEALPNPFVSFCRIPGHETGSVDLYDVSGKLVGTYPGNRVGEGLSPAVYFIKSCERGESLRAVKVR